MFVNAESLNRSFLTASDLAHYLQSALNIVYQRDPAFHHIIFGDDHVSIPQGGFDPSLERFQPGRVADPDFLLDFGKKLLRMVKRFFPDSQVLDLRIQLPIKQYKP